MPREKLLAQREGARMLSSSKAVEKHWVSIKAQLIIKGKNNLWQILWLSVNFGSQQPKSLRFSVETSFTGKHKDISN
jgi:hypothetical protein